MWSSVGLEPTERVVRLARLGLEVRLQETGSGPPVVFVHGASNSGVSWAGLVARLGGFRSIVLDRPGCGLSEPIRGPFADMAAFSEFAETLLVDVLDALKLERAHVVATSFGGYVALRTAAAHADRLDRLVMLGWTVGAPQTRVPAVMRIASLRPVGRLMTAVPANERMVRSVFRRIGLREALENGRVSDELVRCYTSLLRDTGTMRNELEAGPRLITLRGMDERVLLGDDALGRIRTPTSFVWGEGDPFGSPEIARAFVKRIPGAELELVPGGHAVWIDDPDGTAERVRSFFPPSS
jgi:2-hydroxy-6-oxonona-2,4-dienedioate hydrolase